MGTPYGCDTTDMSLLRAVRLPPPWLHDADVKSIHLKGSASPVVPAVRCSCDNGPRTKDTNSKGKPGKAKQAW